MKRLLALLLWTSGAALALAQPQLGTSPVPTTTPFTRYVLGATNQNDFANRAGLGASAVPTIPFLDPGMFNGSGLTVPQQINLSSAATLASANSAATNTTVAFLSPTNHDWYVAPGGSDANNGLSRALPWATPHWAAMHATNFGDTVTFFGGWNSNQLAAPTNIIFSNGVSQFVEEGSRIVLTNWQGLTFGASWALTPNAKQVLKIYYADAAAGSPTVPVGFYNKGTGDNRDVTNCDLWLDLTSESQGFHCEGNNGNNRVEVTIHQLDEKVNMEGFQDKTFPNSIIRVLAHHIILTNWFSGTVGKPASKPFAVWHLAPGPGGLVTVGPGEDTYSDSMLTNIPCYWLQIEGGGSFDNFFSGCRLHPIGITNALSYDINGAVGALRVATDCRRIDGKPITENPADVNYGLDMSSPNMAATTLGGYSAYYTNGAPTAASYPAGVIVIGPSGPGWTTNSTWLPFAFGPVTYIGGISSANATFASTQTGNGSSNLTMTITSIPSSTVQGAAVGAAAPAGIVGEQAVSNVTSGVAFSLSTGAPLSITNLTLTAGDWIILGTVNFIESSATVTARAATFATTGSLQSGANTLYNSWNMAQTTTSTQTNTVVLVPRIINASSTVQYNLNVMAAFSAGTVSAFGTATAIRFY